MVQLRYFFFGGAKMMSLQWLRAGAPLTLPFLFIQVLVNQPASSQTPTPTPVCTIYVSGGSGLQAATNADLDSVSSGQVIGAGDGRIHIIPTLSSPSVKNGDKLSLSVIVKAQAGVAKVEADLGGIETIELTPAPTNLGGINSDGTLGM